MNKKTKRIVGVLTVSLLVVICLIIIVMSINNTSSEKQEKQKKENVAQSLIISEEQGDSSEVELVKEEEPNKIEVKKKEDATDSEWLAAGMVIAISLQYPEFEIEEIYISAKDEKEAYVIFDSSGEKVIIHSKALNEEREDSGTRDIYTEELGFATFDEIPESNMNVENMTKIVLEDLQSLISQSLLVSVYER